MEKRQAYPNHLDPIITKISTLKPDLMRRFHVRSLGLFGSCVQGTDGPASDLDLLVDFDEDADLFDLTGLALFLEEKIGRQIDVVPRHARGT